MCVCVCVPRDVCAIIYKIIVPKFVVKTGRAEIEREGERRGKEMAAGSYKVQQLFI